MRYRIVHRTTYDYSDMVEYSQNLLHLSPRVVTGQTRLTSKLEIDPLPVDVETFDDVFGNPTHHVTIATPHKRMTVTAHTELELDPPGERLLHMTSPWDQVGAVLRRETSSESLDALQYVYGSQYVPVAPELAAYAKPDFAEGRPLLEAADDFTRRIYKEFEYDGRATTITTPVLELLELKRGVCQDFAHLALACLRSLGLACRYVSGYLRTDPKPGQPRLQGVDASHAWFSVFSPELGWIDFDPTNGCLCSDRHITLAWGLDFHDVSPVKGVVLGGGQARLGVAVDVIPVVRSA